MPGDSSSGSLKLKGLDNHWVQIISGRSEFKLMGMPESDFPELPDAGRGKKALAFTEVPAHLLSDLLVKTQFSVSTDEARVNLNGVLFECDGATATTVSTDGHRLTRYTCRFPGPKLDKGIIIPRKGMLEIRRLLDRVQGDVALGIGEQHLFVKAEELAMSVKLNNVQFPPYKAVIPTNHQRRVLVSREELLSALRRAEVMAPEKTATVRLQLAKGKLELTADNPDLGVGHQSACAGEAFLLAGVAMCLRQQVADDAAHLGEAVRLHEVGVRPGFQRRAQQWERHR